MSHFNKIQIIAAFLGSYIPGSLSTAENVICSGWRDLIKSSRILTTKNLTFTYFFYLKKLLTFQCFCFPFSNKRRWWDDAPDCQPSFWTSTTHVVRLQTSSEWVFKKKRRHSLADVIVCIYKTNMKGWGWGESLCPHIFTLLCQILNKIVKQKCNYLRCQQPSISALLCCL